MMCFLITLWVLSTQFLVVRKTSLNRSWFLALSGSAVLFYQADNIFLLCLSWSLMGVTSQAIVGKRPTRNTRRSVACMLAISFPSTFLCFVAVLGTLADGDQCWTLSLQFPRQTLSSDYAFIGFIGMSVKSLLFPFSIWLLSAMKGIAIMSSLVHSLTIVFSGVFITLRLTIEGWIWLKHIELTGLPFLLSSLCHVYFICREERVKRLLAWSTALSVNLCHVSLPWDLRFSMLYGVLHGLSKSFLFASSQGCKSIEWSLLSGLLGSFPLSLVWKVKASFLIENQASLYFYSWGLISYGLLFVKLGYKHVASTYKVLPWNKFGQSWFAVAVLISLVCLD